MDPGQGVSLNIYFYANLNWFQFSFHGSGQLIPSVLDRSALELSSSQEDTHCATLWVMPMIRLSLVCIQRHIRYPLVKLRTCQ